MFVIKPDMTAELRQVAVERSDGADAILSKGLANGEQVVTRGQLRLSPGSKVMIAKPQVPAS